MGLKEFFAKMFGKQTNESKDLKENIVSPQFSEKMPTVDSSSNNTEVKEQPTNVPSHEQPEVGSESDQK